MCEFGFSMKFIKNKPPTSSLPNPVLHHLLYDSDYPSVHKYYENKNNLEKQEITIFPTRS